MRRREFLSVAGVSLLLGGCWGNSVTRRFRVIATAEVDGEPVEGSTVMEVTYTKVTKSLMGAGGAANLKGEALILDLPGKGTVYLLPIAHGKTTGAIGEVYEHSILTTLGIDGDVGSLDDARLDVIRRAKGRIRHCWPSRNDPEGLPAFVAFADEKVPRTIYEVDPFKMGDSFPGAKFTGLYIDFTDAQLTHVLTKRLPWLAEKLTSPNYWERTHFERDRPGHSRPAKDSPLGFKILESSFFARGGH